MQIALKRNSSKFVDKKNGTNGEAIVVYKLLCIYIKCLMFCKHIVKHAWDFKTILPYNRRFYQSLFQNVTNIQHHVIHITNGTIESKVKLTSITTNVVFIY